MGKQDTLFAYLRVCSINCFADRFIILFIPVYVNTLIVEVKSDGHSTLRF